MEGIIIDPADDSDTIDASVKSLGVNIKAIFLTHGHFDHIGAADELKRLYLCYLGNRQCTLSKKERKDLIHKLYRTEPWKCVGEKRYYRSAGRKYKVKSLLYRYKMLFLSLKIMSIMGK